MKAKGSFNLDQKLNTTGIKAIHYEKAFVTMRIADLRGIKNQIQFKWNKKTLKIEQGSALSPIIKSIVTIKIPELSDSTDEIFGFEFNLDLQGSKELTFIPSGGNTEVSLQSTWEAPSFKGKFLSDSRKVSKDGFQANWKVLELNKNFPQSFVGSGFSNITRESSFGVDLIVPLDDYQKPFRSVKYAAMTIALTFLIFFLI